MLISVEVDTEREQEIDQVRHATAPVDHRLMNRDGGIDGTVVPIITANTQRAIGYGQLEIDEKGR